MSDVLLPISGVVYYFAADLGGTTNVALILVKQKLRTPNFTGPTPVLPRIVIIVEERHDVLPTDHTAAFLEQLTKALKNLDPLRSSVDSTDRVNLHFGSIKASCFGQSNRGIRATAIRGQMQATVYSLIQRRKDRRVLFNFKHIQSFSSILLENFGSTGPIDFTFVKASRPQGFRIDTFSYHVREVLDLIPSEAWLWHFIALLVASCILVAMYRPKCHRKWFYPRYETP